MNQDDAIEIKRRSQLKKPLYWLLVVLMYALPCTIVTVIMKAFLSNAALADVNMWHFGQIELLIVGTSATIASILHIQITVRRAYTVFGNILHFLPLDPKDMYHQRFHQSIAAANQRVTHRYTLVPVVLPTTAQNAFCIGASKTKAIIGITEGLLAHLNAQQLKALVAQQLAFIVSGAAYYNTFACALFGLPLAMMANYSEALDQRKYAVHPKHPFYGHETFDTKTRKFALRMMQRYIGIMHSIAIALISRKLHYRADADASRMTDNPIALSEALYIISNGWSGSKIVDSHLAPLFILNPVRRAYDEQEGIVANCYSVHPPVHKRIRVLAAMARADLDAVRSRLESDGKTGAAQIVSQGDDTSEWMILAQGHGWAGPFTMNDLTQSSLMNPDTWLKPAEGGDMIQAKEDPRFAACYQQNDGNVELSGLNCPHCREALAKVHYEGIEALRCRFCQGTMMADDKMRRLLSRGAKQFDERVARLGDIAIAEGKSHNNAMLGFIEHSYIQCAQCHRRMERDQFSSEFFVMIDRCNACSLSWYDKDEIDIIQYIAQKKSL